MSTPIVEITIQISEILAKELQPYQERLPEVLERGLREVQAEETGAFGDEAENIALLTSQPTPEQILAIQPSAELQDRASELLALSKEGELSPRDQSELDRYLTLEHLVRLAKAHAAGQLIQHP